jgi:tetratricopeptide (TPR) repeat protein
MYLLRLITLVAVGGTLSAPLAAQGIPRNARTSTVNLAPRFMVANPFAFAPGDSAPAVAIGSALREQMKEVVGRDFQVVEQSQMNDALTQYGYPKDAILSPALATTLAKNIQARFLVSSTLSKGQGGRSVVTARVLGVNDDAGNVVSLAQNQGESPQAFGKRLAQALDPMVESIADAKSCIEQRTSKADKAVDAANKAIKAVPNHGLAHYCLALIAQDKKAPRAEVVKHLQASAKGDPLSLPVWTALATQYQQAKDTAKTLVAFKEMLRVAPTNQKLREELFKYFLQSGHPETALEVADEGLKIDPYNADLYDLKSNACLFLSNFKCAVDALEAGAERGRYPLAGLLDVFAGKAAGAMQRRGVADPPRRFDVGVQRLGEHWRGRSVIKVCHLAHKPSTRPPPALAAAALWQVPARAAARRTRLFTLANLIGGLRHDLE